MPEDGVTDHDTAVTGPWGCSIMMVLCCSAVRDCKTKQQLLCREDGLRWIQAAHKKLVLRLGGADWRLDVSRLRIGEDGRGCCKRVRYVWGRGRSCPWGNLGAAGKGRSLGVWIVFARLPRSAWCRHCEVLCCSFLHHARSHYRRDLPLCLFHRLANLGIRPSRAETSLCLGMVRAMYGIRSIADADADEGLKGEATQPSRTDLAHHSQSCHNCNALRIARLEAKDKDKKEAVAVDEGPGRLAWRPGLVALLLFLLFSATPVSRSPSFRLPSPSPSFPASTLWCLRFSVPLSRLCAWH